ncbi:MAG: diphthamide biosynthesis enzyme Dph2 [Candidatus Hodarchaeota archaeon]
MSKYDLELERIKDVIVKNEYKTVLIQMPEGLLDDHLKEVINLLSSLGTRVFVSGDPSYGVCDLAIDQAIRLKCDLLIHFGHTSFGFESKVKSAPKSLDILLIPAYVKLSISSHLPKVLNEINQLKWKKIGITATTQHLKNLKELEDFIKENCKRITLQSQNQILGCHIERIDHLSKEVDGVISLHSGSFHSLGLVLNLSIPILQLDPYTGEINYHGEEDQRTYIRKRHGMINRARTASTWGILGSSKLGQYYPKQISKAERILTDNNKFTILIFAENLNPQHLENITSVDAWVTTACPRLAIGDEIRFNKPILTYREFLYLFDVITWDELITKGFF